MGTQQVTASSRTYVQRHETMRPLCICQHAECQRDKPVRTRTRGWCSVYSTQASLKNSMEKCAKSTKQLRKSGNDLTFLNMQIHQRTDSWSGEANYHPDSMQVNRNLLCRSGMHECNPADWGSRFSKLDCPQTRTTRRNVLISLLLSWIHGQDLKSFCGMAPNKVPLGRRAQRSSQRTEINISLPMTTCWKLWRLRWKAS